MTFLTQDEADVLIKIEKKAISSKCYEFPNDNKLKVSIPLTSVDGEYKFDLDISRGSINLSKIKYQNRTLKNTILIRIDICSSPHMNPDGMYVPPTHCHIYKEGYNDRFAYPLPDEFNKINPDDIKKMVTTFLKYCNITEDGLFKFKEFPGTIL